MTAARLEIILAIHVDDTGYEQIVIPDGPKFVVDLLYNRDYATPHQLFKGTRTRETPDAPAQVILTRYTMNRATEIMRGTHAEFLTELVHLARALLRLCENESVPDAAMPFRELAEERTKNRTEPLIPFYPDIIQGD